MAGLWRDLREDMEERLRVVGTMLFDAVMVAVAALLNWGVAQLVEPLELHAIDLVVVIGLQWLCGISTLGVTLAFLARDLGRAFRRVLRQSGD